MSFSTTENFVHNIISTTLLHSLSICQLYFNHLPKTIIIWHSSCTIVSKKREFQKTQNLPIKIIGSTEVKKPLNVFVHKVSKGAMKALEKSKSKVSIVSTEKNKTVKSAKK